MAAEGKNGALYNMEELFIPNTQAHILKSLGFDEPCFAFYQGDDKRPVMVDDDNQYSIFGFRTCGNSEIPYDFTAAPLYSQAFKWFRDRYKLSCSIELTDDTNKYYYDFTISDSKNRDYNDEDFFDSCKRIYDDRKFSKYEQAELECLKKLIEIVKNK